MMVRLINYLLELQQWWEESRCETQRVMQWANQRTYRALYPPGSSRLNLLCITLPVPTSVGRLFLCPHTCTGNHEILRKIFVQHRLCRQYHTTGVTNGIKYQIFQQIIHATTQIYRLFPNIPTSPKIRSKCGCAGMASASLRRSASRHGGSFSRLPGEKL